jgi:hypothetical protein
MFRIRNEIRKKHRHLKGTQAWGLASFCVDSGVPIASLAVINDSSDQLLPVSISNVSGDEVL